MDEVAERSDDTRLVSEIMGRSVKARRYAQNKEHCVATRLPSDRNGDMKARSFRLDP